jgi:hypothetical protein
MKHILFLVCVSFFGVMITGCESYEPHALLSSNDTLHFTGTFRTIHSEDAMGEVDLKMFRGFYKGSTSLPYGRGSGHISIEENAIHFADTMFLIIPAVYGPTYMPTGEYRYEFDGRTLWFGKQENSELEYTLELVD